MRLLHYAYIPVSNRNMDVDIGEIIGRNLRHYRNERGLSQWRLSEVSGVSRPVIAKLELGKLPTPRSDTVAQLAQALKVPVDALLQEERHTADFQPIVDRFLSSEFAKILSLTETEIAWLRSVTSVDWVGKVPNDRSLYDLISALRGGNDAQK